MKHFIIAMLCFLGLTFNAISQKDDNISEHNIKLMTDSRERNYIKSWDSIRIYKNGICKFGYFITIEKPVFKNRNSDIKSFSIIENKRAKVSGEVMYEYIYRSLIDTPFVQNNFSQHTVFSRLRITSRDGVPLNLNFRIRVSNSLFFKNSIDFRTSFTKELLLNNVKENLHNNVNNILTDYRLDSLENYYKIKLQELSLNNYKLGNHNSLQKLVEKKERESKRKFRASHGLVDVEIVDSLKITRDSSLDIAVGINEYELLKESKKEIEDELKSLLLKINKIKKDLYDKRKLLRDEISGVKDQKSFDDLIYKYELPDTCLPKRYRLLMGVNNFGLGRNWVNYSELTVKNTLVSGLNLETNFRPFLFSITAGSINYGFRDFVANTNNLPKQKIFAIRMGLGESEGKRIILTYYTGKKGLINSNIGNAEKIESVSGLSLESSLKIHNTTTISFEIAKSTLPNYLSNVNSNSKILDFNLRANEAYAFKFHSDYFNNTSIKGLYKRAGDQFQSFNMMPVSVQQEAWSFNVSRSFFKKKIIVEAGIKKNDFVNNLTNVGLTSETIFKTLSVNVRVPKYPYLTLGYYPSTQLTVLDNQQVAESFYNTFNIVVGHVYRLGGKIFTSNIVFVKFSSEANDTNFVYANSESFTVHQTVLFKNSRAQFTYSRLSQPAYLMYTLEGHFAYTINKWLSASAGVKKVTSPKFNDYGKSIGMQIKIRELGSVQLQYEQNYLLGRNRTLVPVDFGKLIYTKKFK